MIIWWLRNRNLYKQKQLIIRGLPEYWEIINIWSTGDMGLKISSDSIWSADIYQNITRSTHGHLMIMIRRSAKTADDHLTISRILTNNQRITIWWSLVEDQGEQKMIIKWLQEYCCIINTRSTDGHHVTVSTSSYSKWSSYDCQNIDRISI